MSLDRFGFFPVAEVLVVLFGTLTHTVTHTHTHTHTYKHSDAGTQTCRDA